MDIKDNIAVTDELLIGYIESKYGYKVIDIGKGYRLLYFDESSGEWCPKNKTVYSGLYSIMDYLEEKKELIKITKEEKIKKLYEMQSTVNCLLDEHIDRYGKYIRAIEDDLEILEKLKKSISKREKYKININITETNENKALYEWAKN